MSQTTHALPEIAAAKPWTLREVIGNLHRDIPAGSYVNVGIGLPSLLIDVTGEVGGNFTLHTENGILGIAGRPAPHEVTPNTPVDAGKDMLRLGPAAATFDSATSFAMLRGGRMDLAVMGAYQVSFEGDLANWSHPSSPIPAIGGAADIASGVNEIWIAMRLFDEHGRPKVMRECTLPLTAKRCVTRVYTEYGTIEIQPGGRLVVRDVCDGLTAGELEQLLAAEPDA